MFVGYIIFEILWRFAPFFSVHFNVVASVLFDITKILQDYFLQDYYFDNIESEISLQVLSFYRWEMKKIKSLRWRLLLFLSRNLLKYIVSQKSGDVFFSNFESLWWPFLSFFFFFSTYFHEKTLTIWVITLDLLHKYYPSHRIRILNSPLFLEASWNVRPLIHPWCHVYLK